MGVSFKSGRRRAGSDRPMSRRGLVFFFSIFALAGVLALVFTTIRPLLRVYQAKQWPQVECVILSSEVRHHTDSDGTTYSPHIVYRYQFNGSSHEAERYDFLGGSSSGYDGKREIVERYPRGSLRKCFVNPENPHEAVLHRGVPGIIWVLAPFSLLFLGIGLGGMWAVGVKGYRANARGEWIKPGESQPLAEQPELVLKPRYSPLTKLMGALFVMAFWNGIVSVFVVDAVKGWQRGHPDYFLTLFMVPFVVIGLGFVALCFYCLLSLWNPVPTVKLRPAAVRLGGSVHVEWNVAGRAHLIQRLTVNLLGREEAAYRSGKDRTTDRNLFARVELVSTTAAPEIQNGTVLVDMPVNLMHSFESDHTRIVWTVQVHGEIEKWPDVNEEFPLTVLPA